MGAPDWVDAFPYWKWGFLSQPCLITSPAHFSLAAWLRPSTSTRSMLGSLRDTAVRRIGSIRLPRVPWPFRNWKNIAADLVSVIDFGNLVCRKSDWLGKIILSKKHIFCQTYHAKRNFQNHIFLASFRHVFSKNVQLSGTSHHFQGKKLSTIFFQIFCGFFSYDELNWLYLMAIFGYIWAMFWAMFFLFIEVFLMKTLFFFCLVLNRHWDSLYMFLWKPCSSRRTRIFTPQNPTKKRLVL